jgi:hypothetical protein
MLAALESPEANDIVNFSLEILPSVLETKTRPAAGSTAAHGYSGHRDARIDRQPRAHGARVGRHGARAPPHGQRGALLRPRAEQGRAEAHSLPADRRLRLDARRPADLRAGHGDRHGQEAPAGRGGGRVPLLRLAPLRAAAHPQRIHPHGVPALVPRGARAQPGARLRGAGDRSRSAPPPRRALPGAPPLHARGALHPARDGPGRARARADRGRVHPAVRQQEARSRLPRSPQRALGRRPRHARERIRPRRRREDDPRRPVAEDPRGGCARAAREPAIRIRPAASMRPPPSVRGSSASVRPPPAGEP